MGRDEDLASLDALARQAETGDARIVVLTGPVGVGKSALANELTAGLNEAGRFVVLRGRRPPGADVTRAMRDALEGHFGLRGRRSTDVEAVLGGLMGIELVEDLVALLRAGHRGPLDLRDACATFLRMVRELGRRRPVAVVLDDLEPDTATAILVETVAFELSIEPIPLLLLLPMQPLSSDDPLSRVRGRGGPLEPRVVPVEPLPVDVLSRHLEQRHRLSPRDAEATAQRADGNPLFARYLVEHKWTPSQGEADTVAAQQVSDSGLPAALRASLDRGLRERLVGPSNRVDCEATLEDVAVLGVEVDVALLAAVSGVREATLDQRLDALIEVEVLRDRDVDRVAFAHRLLRDVVLAQMSPRKRRRMHRRAAEVRAERGAPDGVVGEHWFEAGEHDRAIELWLADHDESYRQGDRLGAMCWGRLAIEAMPPGDHRRHGVVLRLGRLLRDDADLESAEAMLQSLRDGADADTGLRAAEILAGIVQERNQIDAWRELVAWMDQRAAVATEEGLGAYQRAAAFLCNSMGEMPRAIELAEAAWSRSFDPVDVVNCARRLAYSHAALGDFDEARVWVARGRERLKRLGASELDIDELELRIALFLRDVAATAAMRQIASIFRRRGRMAQHVSVSIELTAVLIESGQHDEAHRIAEDAVAVARRFGLVMEQGRLVGNMALSAVIRDDPERAAQLAAAIPGVLEHRGFSPAQLVLAMVQLAERDPAGLERLCALREMPSLPSVWFFDEVLRPLVRLLSEQGESELAVAMQTRLCARLERFGDEGLLQAARQGLAELEAAAV